jgi:hypothetical protein
VSNLPEGTELVSVQFGDYCFFESPVCSIRRPNLAGHFKNDLPRPCRKYQFSTLILATLRNGTERLMLFNSLSYSGRTFNSF